MERCFTLTELAQIVSGKVVGDGSRTITGVAPIHLAKESDLTFLLDEKIAKKLESTQAAVLIPLGKEDLLPGKTLLAVDDVSACIDKIAELFHPVRQDIKAGISPQAAVDPTAEISETAAIGAGVFIGPEVKIADGVKIYPNTVILGGTTIDSGTTIFPNVAIYENTVIGKNCIIHSGTVIGAYGFGYSSTASGHTLSAQLGNVVIEDDVEIGACTTIDRATHGSTRIGCGTKIDNLVMIAHNCSLGRFNLICAHTGVAGSTTTGDFVVMAGRVGVKDHIHIGTGAVLGAMAGVMEDIPEKAQYVGIPATDFKEQFKKQAALAKLPAMRREFIALQNEVKRLSERLAALEPDK